MKIDILQTEYSLRFDDPSDNPVLGDESEGYTDFEKKEIVVAYKEEDRFTYPVLRHELIHAFMYESGLGSSWEHTANGQDETTVDWFAIQYPKIHRLFKELGIKFLKKLAVSEKEAAFLVDIGIYL